MDEYGGFFEEMNSEDVEEVELSASEEQYESIDEFKESAVYDEIDGVLREVEQNEQSEGSSELYSSNDLSQDLSGSGNVRVIYVDKNSVSNFQETVSGCSVVILDNSQFEILVDEISSTKSEPVNEITVSMNDYSEDIQKLRETVEGSLLVNILIFSLCFGYFVKETIFRGV